MDDDAPLDWEVIGKAVGLLLLACSAPVLVAAFAPALIVAASALAATGTLLLAMAYLP